MSKIVVAAAAGLLVHASAFAQGFPCTRLEGTIRDPTNAVIRGAVLTLHGTHETNSGPNGQFLFECETEGRITLTVTADGFLPYRVQVTLPHAALNIKLIPATEASITVTADDDDQQVKAPGGGNGLIVAGKQLQALADDPDDLLRQLQQLSAASGGSPGKATISVDGFQDSASLPPKDSIAFINVSPDLFSAEYREPPFGGGRVEVYTKPGAKNFHGALFTTNSSSWMNARDAFTTTQGAIGKQRYGFDLSGPIRKKGSNFSVNFEHRAINETVGVNAIVAGPSGNPVPFFDTIAVPQSLWEANARADYQVTPKDFAFISYNVNTSHYQNQGAGGQTLREAGYDQSSFDQTVRASNVTTLSPRALHETRLSFEHYNQTDIPTSTAPSIQVAGYYTGGGASVGQERDHRSRVEFGDDLILNTRQHSIKAGIQFFYIHRNSLVPTNFNGTYTFSGYNTSPTTTVTALQQYQQAQAGTTTATQFQNVAGDPNVVVSQVRFAAFFQDNIKFNSHWTGYFGFRYALQTNPNSYNGVGPRVGFSYSPDKKESLVIKAHFGVFYEQYGADDAQELRREDGVQRVTSIVTNPVLGIPFSGATPVHSLRTQAPGLNLPTNVVGDLSVSKDLPFGFNVNVQEVQIRFLTNTRTVDINQPLTPGGVRPFTPNTNILQTRSDGTGQGHGEFFGLSNFKQKYVQFFVGALYLNVRENNNDNNFFQPQSAYSDAGETAPRSSEGKWQVFGNTTFNLPYKLILSGNGYASGKQPFNLLTGFDNNGDGTFNDRPQFAPAGSVANGSTVFQTPFGLFTNSGAQVNGAPVAPIQRNLGILPWSFHLDANLQRAFILTRNAKADHQQIITANVRSANFLNHTNVTADGNVLGSPNFLVPVSADTARRLEFGLRYSF